MADHAISTHAGVQAQLDRLGTLSPGADVLGLERIAALLSRLGDPQLALPPVFHVAGTNGKGSTCAFLRAALEGAGHAVHVYSSPHLVRFNERIRVAGRLIDDETLARLLAEVLDIAGDIAPSFFEVTTAAAFLAFARTPAAATIVEVGLGGRLDATNVVPAPLVTGIAALGVDHQFFLGDTAEEIAGEKAGIAKRGVPLVTMAYPPSLAARVAVVANAAGAPLFVQDRDWSAPRHGDHVHYRDPHGELLAAAPRLAGLHQTDNLALALAMLRHQTALPLPDAALIEAGRRAAWPARMQRLREGPLLARLDQLAATPTFHGLYVDGAHNVAAAQAVRDTWRDIAAAEDTAIVIGMLANKDAAGVLALLTDTGAATHVVTLPVQGHAHHAPADLAAIARASGAAADVVPSLADAVSLIAARGRARSVLIAGSLYLAGEALAANDELPD